MFFLLISLFYFIYRNLSKLTLDKRDSDLIYYFSTLYGRVPEDSRHSEWNEESLRSFASLEDDDGGI